MIRRGFWLTAGAVTGIMAYRRVSAVGRRLSARLNLGTSTQAIGGTVGTSLRAPTGAGQPKPLFSVRRTRRAAIRADPGDLPFHLRRAGGHGALYGSAFRVRRPYPQYPQD